MTRFKDLRFKNLWSRLRRPWKFRREPGAAGGDLVFLLGLGLVLFTSGLGLREPWPADEPRFALVAKEMVESGHWFFPRRASELYADKPPLFMWAVAAGYALTGSMRVAFLLPSLFAGLGILALTYDLGRRLWHRRAGLAAGLALLAIVQFPLQAKTGQIDASVTLWTTLGLYGLCRHLLLGPSWGWWYTGFFAMGLGIITKGVGFLPLLALLPWALARSGGWRPLSPAGRGGWRWALGPLAMLFAIGLWLVPMLILVERSGDPSLASYRDEILLGQTAERYTSFEGHQQPIWYYPAEVIPGLWMPASLLLPWLVPAWWRRLKRRDARYLLFLGWIVLVVTFFTFSSGKRGVYVLPAVPALALACGPLVSGRLGRLRGPRWAAFGLLALLATVFLAVAAGGFAGAEWSVRIAEKHRVAPWGLAGALGLVGLGWAGVLRPRRGLAGLAGFLGCCWIFYGWWGYPLLDPARSASVLMRDVSGRIGPGAELALVGWKEQMILQSDRPVTHWGYLGSRGPSEASAVQVRQASRWLLEPSPSERFLLLPSDWAEPCIDTARTVPFGVWHGHDWKLAGRDTALEGCSAGEGGEIPTYTTDWQSAGSTEEPR